jgi:transposase-like protein
MWTTRWQGLRASGLRMSEYARREGFDAHSAYRWRRSARLSGRWSDTEPVKSAVVARPPTAVSFARVAVTDAPAVRSALLLRAVLLSGRRVELELGAIGQLGEVLEVLERRS